MTRGSATERVAGLVGDASVPDLAFAVEGVEAVRFAAVPTLGFRLRVASAGGEPIRSLALTVQVRIAATRRSYDEESQARLLELFGQPAQWGQTLRSLLWTQTTLLVPAFTGSTLVELPVPCTYDFEVAATKYLHALRDGDVPLELLFSGTVFFVTAGGTLQVAQIPWDKELAHPLPVRVWKETMDHYFPGTAWVRLRRETFDRLHAYRARNAFPTWEAAVEALLGAREDAR